MVFFYAILSIIARILLFPAFAVWRGFRWLWGKFSDCFSGPKKPNSWM